MDLIMGTHKKKLLFRWFMIETKLFQFQLRVLGKIGIYGGLAINGVVGAEAACMANGFWEGQREILLWGFEKSLLRFWDFVVVNYNFFFLIIIFSFNSFTILTCNSNLHFRKLTSWMIYWNAIIFNWKIKLKRKSI